MQLKQLVILVDLVSPYGSAGGSQVVLRVNGMEILKKEVDGLPNSRVESALMGLIEDEVRVFLQGATE